MKNVAQRYNLTTQSAITLIKKHYTELNANGVHAQVVNGEWVVDQEGIRILDAILHAGQNKRKKEEKIVTAEDLQHEIVTLRQMLADKEQERSNLESEYKSLEERFMSLKDDMASVNEDLIRKYRTKSETLERQLEQARADMSKMRDLKNERIHEQECMVEQLQTKVDELNRSLQKKIESDLENLSKSAEADKLMDRIHDMETERADMASVIEKMKLEVVSANEYADDMERVLNGVMENLDRTKQRIAKCLSVKAELRISPEEAQTEIAEKPEAIEETALKIPPDTEAIPMQEISAAVPASIPTKEVPTKFSPYAQEEHARQEAAMRQMRKAQQEEIELQETRRSKGLFAWLSSRAASFLP